jgi:hypothetical protein
VNVPYASPAAFRRALTDRLRRIAQPRGPWPLPELQRQFGYDRLLARLYHVDDRWIVKGATALLARAIIVRHTVDIDLYRAVEQDQAERDLRAAASLDLGDWVRFEIGPATPVADAGNGARLPVTATIGTTPWTRFHVDVVAEGVRMTGAPDDVAPLISDVIPGLEQPTYRAYPLVDHIADKIAAILERHGPTNRPSTRYKDLVDLVALVNRAATPALPQQRALDSEAERRSLMLPPHFDVPDLAQWRIGYAAEARRAVGLSAGTLDEALATVRPFVEPLFHHTATGSWNPQEQRWVAESQIHELTSIESNPSG